MADKDFVVKNGLQVNGGTFVINAGSLIYNSTLISNTTVFTGKAYTANVANTANNSSFLGGVAAASYVNTSGNYTLSGNVIFSGNLSLTGANISLSSGITIGSNVVVNTSAYFVGNSTANAYLTVNGVFVNGSPQAVSGSYYKGNFGSFGNEIDKNNLYRINANNQSNNVTILDGENSFTVGPMTIDSSYNLTIENGGRVVII